MTSDDTPRSPSASCCGGAGCAGGASSTATSTHPADVASDTVQHNGTPRRTVLSHGSLAAVAGVGVLGLTGCTQEIRERDTARQHYTGSEMTDALPAADLPVGTSKEVEVEGRTLLMHRVDESTVTAYSNVCTHQGCLLQPADRPEGPAYACPCHGSHFDVETGKPFGGPARQPLMDFQAAVDGDRIVVKL